MSPSERAEAVVCGVLLLLLVLVALLPVLFDK